MLLPIFDLVSQAWLPEGCEVSYRNTLLGALYPDVKFAIGDVSALLAKKKPDYTAIAKLLDEGFEDYQIVGASGARKHGRVLFAQGGGDYFTRFFGSNANAINYGSNLTTECKKIITIPVKLLVVADGEYNTGDCHGKCSDIMAVAIADSLNNPFQFRAANLSPAWIAKGTIAYSPLVDDSGYDLILPASCFKGNKVTPGEYNLPELTIGLVFASPAIKHQTKRLDWRRTRLSYSVVQYFPWDAVSKDILPGTIKVANEINETLTNQRKLAEYLLGSEDYDTETEEEEDEYKSTLARLVGADIHGQLTSHPWVVDKTADLFRSRWMTLATAGATKFNSSMVMPDESLPNDCIYIPGLPDGEEVIVFPYPCRWKYDIKVWRNVKLDSWEDAEGVLVVNKGTALELGRDFDGDTLSWLPARKLPAIAAAVKAFGKPPISQKGLKPNKQPVVGSLGEIAVKSMANDTGLITWLIAKSWAMGKEDLVNQLVPQLQAAVDSLKGAAPPDKELLNSISKELKGDVAWLKENKEPHRYLTQLVTDDGRTDTISQLVREINKLWISPTLRKSKFTTFRPLFEEPKANWLNRAKLRCAEYTTAIAEVCKEERAYLQRGESVPKRVAEACALKRKAVVKKWETLLDGCTSKKSRTDAVGAIWHSKHHSNSTDQSNTFLCFFLGLEEICERLQTLRINKLHVCQTAQGISHTDYPEHTWQGELMPLRLVTHTNGYLFAQDADGKFLGYLSVNDSPTLLKDVWFEATVTSRKSYTEVMVLDNF